jgi:hypothetical protein
VSPTPPTASCINLTIGGFHNPRSVTVLRSLRLREFELDFNQSGFSANATSLGLLACGQNQQLARNENRQISGGVLH